MPTLRYILTIACPDRVGIVAAVSNALADHAGNIVESSPISFGIIIAFVENRDFSSLNRVVAGIPSRCLPWEHGVPEPQPSGEAGAAGERLYPNP